MTQRFRVELDADHFDRLAKPTAPLAGITELIWNALDAEATRVDVTIERDEIGGVEEVEISDNGHGMTQTEAIRDFHRLGGSWKKSTATSKNGVRPLHGKEGAGRFRAFAVGSEVVWHSTSIDHEGHAATTEISGALDRSEFVVDESVRNGSAIGTEVRISSPREYAHRLLAEDASTVLVIQLALYLIKFPDVLVTYDGTDLDPSSIIERETEIVVAIDNHDLSGFEQPRLRIIEWDKEAKSIRPSLILCTEDGVALEEFGNDMDTRLGIPYTAYLSWPGFAEHIHELVLANLGHESLAPVVLAARDAIGDYVDLRLGERRSEQIVKWKADGVYPFSGEPSNDAEIQERKVFDLLATSAAPSLGKEKRAAKMSLRLLREAMAQPPEALHRVLEEVLGLTPEQVQDLAQLLERTTLASMIYTTRLVVDRLSFVDDLESLLFDADKRPKLLERTQLHEILENGKGWIFGEEYSLAVSDRGLTAVLDAHLSLIGSDVAIDAPVTDLEGRPRRVDLMYSKALRQASQRQHLVVELKRPSVQLTMDEVSQISNYASAVIADDRFDSHDVRWVFSLVGDSMDDAVRRFINQPDRPLGLYLRGENYEIWVKTWAEVLEENRQRLHFYREHLDYESQGSQALDELLTKYLPATNYGEEETSDPS